MVEQVRGSKPSSGRITLHSGVLATLTLNATAGDEALPSVVVPSGLLPEGTSMVRATASISIRKTGNSSGSTNAIVAAQVIECDITGGFATTAIDIVDNSLSTTGSADNSGTTIYGTQDIQAEVTEGSTTLFQWTAADVDAASLTLYDLQMHIEIEYE